MKKIATIIILFFLHPASIAQVKDSLSLHDDNYLLAKFYKELNPHKEIIYLKEIEKRKISDKELMKVFSKVGDSFSYLQDYIKAEYYYLASYKIAKRLRNKKLLPTIALNLAGTTYRLEKYPLSERYFREYRSHFGEYSENPLSITTEMDYSRIYFLNGDFETYLGKMQELYQNFLKQEKLNRDAKLLPNFLMAKATILYTMANTATLLQNKHLAKQYISQARSLLQDHQPLLAPLQDSYHMGAIYTAEIQYALFNSQYEEALLQSSKFYEYATKSNYKDYRFIALVKKACVLYNQKKYGDALRTAKTALTIKTPTYDFFNYEMEAYRMAALSAKELGKNAEALRYSQLFMDKSNKVLNDKKRTMLNSILKNGEKIDIEKQLNHYKTGNLMVSLGLGAAIVLLALLAAYVFYRNRKHRKDYEKFQRIIKGYSNSEIKPEAIPRQSLAAKKNDSDTIPDEKTTEILLKLEEFEKSELFIKQEMSAAYLATYVKTNTGTLSSVINKYKGNNFNDYINSLRIEYIIGKLNDDKKFRTYKISYLAEVSGFSSHSLFSVVFKKHTGIPPSQFIEFLKK